MFTALLVYSNDKFPSHLIRKCFGLINVRSWGRGSGHSPNVVDGCNCAKNSNGSYVKRQIISYDEDAISGHLPVSVSLRKLDRNHFSALNFFLKFGSKLRIVRPRMRSHFVLTIFLSKFVQES